MSLWHASIVCDQFFHDNKNLTYYTHKLYYINIVTIN